MAPILQGDSTLVFVNKWYDLTSAMQYCRKKGMDLHRITSKEAMYQALDLAKKGLADQGDTSMVGALSYIHSTFVKEHTYTGYWYKGPTYNATIHRDLFYKDPLRNMIKNISSNIDGRAIMVGCGIFQLGYPKNETKFAIFPGMEPATFFCQKKALMENVNTITGSLQLTAAPSENLSIFYSDISSGLVLLVAFIVVYVLIKKFFFTSKKSSEKLVDGTSGKSNNASCKKN